MQSTLYDVRFFRNNGHHPEIEEKARQEAFFADVMKVNRLMGFDLTDHYYWDDVLDAETDGYMDGD